MSDNVLILASQKALESGDINVLQHEQLVRYVDNLKALDLVKLVALITQILPYISALVPVPGFQAIVMLVLKVLPYLVDLINNGPSPSPAPGPNPAPIDDIPVPR